MPKHPSKTRPRFCPLKVVCIQCLIIIWMNHAQTTWKKRSTQSSKYIRKKPWRAVTFWRFWRARKRCWKRCNYLENTYSNGQRMIYKYCQCTARYPTMISWKCFSRHREAPERSSSPRISLKHRWPYRALCMWLIVASWKLNGSMLKVIWTVWWWCRLAKLRLNKEPAVRDEFATEKYFDCTLKNPMPICRIKSHRKSVEVISARRCCI